MRGRVSTLADASGPCLLLTPDRGQKTVPGNQQPSLAHSVVPLCFSSHIWTSRVLASPRPKPEGETLLPCPVFFARSPPGLLDAKKARQ